MLCSLRAEAADALPGSVIGETYRVDELIARGGMAFVYRGLHLRLQQPVAIKVQRWVCDSSAHRMDLEAQLHARMSHPNIVGVHDLLSVGERRAIVMDLVQGPTLEQLLQSFGGALDAGEIDAFFLPVVSALGFVHRQGVVHRDVKLGNVLVDRLDRFPRVRLSDFGISCATDELCDEERGVVVGTPSYVAPEHFCGNVAADARADIYSLGVCLYQLVCGELPFGRRTDEQLCLRLRERPRAPRALVPGISSLLEQVILRAIAFDREARFHDADEMHAALRVALEHARLSGHKRTGPLRLPRPWRVPPWPLQQLDELEPTPSTVRACARRLRRCPTRGAPSAAPSPAERESAAEESVGEQKAHGLVERADEADDRLDDLAR